MGKRNKTEKTGIGKFISKVGEFIPDVLGAGIKLAGGDIKGAFDEVREALMGEESNESKGFLQEFKRFEMQWRKEAFELEVRDRDSARSLYKDDSTLQKVVAYFSLAGFSIFTIASMWMGYQILVYKIEINEFVIMTISNANGVFTALLFTLKDFLFGGSINK